MGGAVGSTRHFKPRRRVSGAGRRGAGFHSDGAHLALRLQGLVCDLQHVQFVLSLLQLALQILSGRIVARLLRLLDGRKEL